MYSKGQRLFMNVWVKQISKLHLLQKNGFPYLKILEKNGIYRVAWVQWMEKTFLSGVLIYVEVTIITIKDFTVWCYLLFEIQNIVLFHMTLDTPVVIMTVESPTKLGIP